MSISITDTKLYNILEITPTANKGEIQKTFRTLALKWHPDKWTNATDEEKKKAENKFNEIVYAYEILDDLNTKSKYDKYGEDAIRDRIYNRQMEEMRKNGLL